MDNYASHKAIQFLRWFCKAEFLDEVEGDIIELYELRQAQHPGKANRQLWWDVIRSFRWVNLKKVNTQNNTLSMFNNYFKVGFRNLTRDYRFSVINLIGLSMGLSVFLLMIMMIRHEFSFDTFHSNADRTYQIIQEFRQSDGADPEIWTPTPLAAAMLAEIPAVESSIYLQGTASNWVTVEEKRFFEEDGMIVGSNFFDIFNFELIHGDPLKALASKRSVVISEDLSFKYFGYENPIGKIIEYEAYGPFTVTGVLKNVPNNSYLQFDFVLTQDIETYLENVVSWYPDWYRSWQGHAVSTFVVLKDGTALEHIENQISDLVRRNLDVEEVNKFYLLGLLDLHFGSNGIDGRINQHIKGDIDKVNLFSVVAVVIMLMACFNYINITTARSIKRHKEVGVRKSIGAFRSQLMMQFLVESFLLVFLSLVLSLICSYYLVPLFNEIVGLNLLFSWELIIDLMPWFLGIAVLVTMFSGFYPAIVLSHTSALVLVQKLSARGTRGSLLRNGLVTIQFGAVIIIAACLLIINDQYRYMSEKSLGLKTEEIVVVEINSGAVRNNYLTIKNELKTNPAIKEATGITRVFSGYRSPVSIIGNTADDLETTGAMKFYGIDHEALKVFGLELVAGEGFSGIAGIDSTSVLLNEKAAELYGGHQILGQWIDLVEDQGDHGAELKARVIGIVKDFHFESLHQPIKPTIIGYYKSPFESIDDIIIKIDASRIEQALAHIEKVHNTYDKNDIMDWEFLDDMTQRAYEDEVIFRNVMTMASIVSLFIALLGMIGMISYNIISRTKEFGIRKVLGATFVQLLIVQGRVFVKYLLVASMISIPVAWWISSNWLAAYAFRISMTPMPFLWIVLGLSLLTGLTVYYLGSSTFRQNPTNALRNE
ncbi:MAG: ABC transporter permease [Cytophagales bacterium]|nr:ABC transporter permease [Cytophagales bacterium]